MTVNFSNPLQGHTSSCWCVSLYNESYGEMYSQYIYGNVASTNLSAMGLSADTYYIRVSSCFAYAASTDIYELTVSKYVFNQVKPKKVTLVSAKAGKNMAVLSWKAVSSAAGYEVYMSRSKSGGYKKIRTLSATSCKKKSLTRGNRYYFKVRAYQYGFAGSRVNGPFSNVKAVLVK